ncbi:MAG: 50S ribosomal protein L16 3-hydroxylase [Thermoproteota archaeon]|jgi:50S ribosomal protein L16 3-hydroxylase
MNNDISAFLGDISVDQFLSEYWEKKVLVVKNSVANADKIAIFSDLSDIAEEENFETRVVLETGGEYPWQLKNGPFKKFTDEVKDKKFTLAAHGLNLYFPEFKELEDKVSFLPRWLFDDVMATYSNENSSMGAHYDNYNVFIVQGQGQRRWQIQYNPNMDFSPELDIKLLDHFKCDQEFILETGDMIYIPPHVAHFGTSLKESLSYSIGFRGFSNTSMMSSFFQYIYNKYENFDYFHTDSFIKDDVGAKNKVNEKVFTQLHSIIQSEVLNKKNITDWFSDYLSEPRSPIKPIDAEASLTDLVEGLALFRDFHARLVWFEEEDHFVASINGHHYTCDIAEVNLLESYFSLGAYEPIVFDIKNLSLNLKNILNYLLRQGVFFIDEVES